MEISHCLGTLLLVWLSLALVSSGDSHNETDCETPLPVVWPSPPSPGEPLGQEKESIEVRLTGGTQGTDQEGRVEVLYKGVWGTICDDDFGVEDAAVICRMIGYPGVARVVNASRLYGAGSGQIWLDSLDCEGTERTILDCRRKAWGDTDCTHLEDVGVICFGGKVSTLAPPVRRTTTTRAPPRICDNATDSIMLVGGANEAEGRVLIFHQNEWRAVCDDKWGINDARVICRMLCYHPSHARPHVGGAFGRANETYWMDDVECTGEETDITDCLHNGWGVNDCSELESAGVTCLPEEPALPPLPEPYLECSNERITAVFDRLVEPRLKLEHLSLADPAVDLRACGYEETLDVDWVRVSIPYVGCGTERLLNETDIIYSNVLRHAVPPGSNMITRTNIYNIRVSCALPRDGDPTNEVEPLAQTAAPQVADGKFVVRMNLFNRDFTEPLAEFPAQVTLGENVHVGLHLVTSDPELKIIVPTCTVTPKPDPNSEPIYYLIRERCSEEPSLTTYPFNETFFAFRFQSFKFLGDHPYIYVHCDGWVCDQSEKTESCDRSCGVGGNAIRQRRSLSPGNRPTYSVDSGPVLLLSTIIEEFNPSSSRSDNSMNAMARRTDSGAPVCSQNTLSNMMLICFMVIGLVC